jgi:hypothetical protein
MRSKFGAAGIISVWRNWIAPPQFKNIRTLRTLAENRANQGGVSQFRRPSIKQRAEENYRQIRGMAPLGGIS